MVLSWNDEFSPKSNAENPINIEIIHLFYLKEMWWLFVINQNFDLEKLDLEKKLHLVVHLNMLNGVIFHR